MEGTDLYLDRDAALAEVQRLGQTTGDGLAITGQVLAKRLHERGLLSSTDQGRETLTVRRKLEGKQRRVLHLATAAFGTEAEVATAPIDGSFTDNDDAAAD